MANKSQYKSIPISVTLYLAWKNITHKRLRSILTILGVAIGIGAVYFLLSFGFGLRNLVTEQVVGSQSIKAIDVSTVNSKIIQLNQENYKKMQGFNKVAKYGALLSAPGSIKINQSGETSVVVYAVDKGYVELSNHSIVAGAYSKPDDVDTAYINTATTKAAGIKDPKSVIGQKMNLVVPLQNASQPYLEKDFTIVGVIESGSGSEVYTSYNIFSGLEVNNYSQIKLVAQDRADVANLRKQVESMGFQTVSAIDTVDQIDKVFQIFNIVLGAFGAIGMVIAILGMFNTLTISLIERTKETGLMMALGSRKRDVSRLFIIEALMLSISGAIIGIISAITAELITNGVLNSYAHSRGVSESFNLFANPWWLQIAMIVFMLIIGLLVAILPAKRAERINPIDALRQE